MSASDKMFDYIFEFKSSAKQMEREGKRSEANSKKLINNVKKCIEKGDYEGAKLAASDAIREKNSGKRYKILSSKINTVVSRLKAAYQNQKMTENMTSLTQKLMDATKGMDIVTMTETMSNFEKMFDNLDVNSNMMDQVMDNVNAGTVNENEVDTLIQQIAQQNNMKLGDEFADMTVGTGAVQEDPNQEMNLADGFPRM